MRNPSTISKSDDLSCLTSSSTSSQDQPPQTNFPILIDTSSYLPKVIDPSEWLHQSNGGRKRKERQDSTSSITQDRKFVRSNSEEYLPNVDYEVIRRVSSHDEIKNSAVYTIDDDDLSEHRRPIGNDDGCGSGSGNGDGNGSHASRMAVHRYRCGVVASKSNNNEVQEILRETYRRSETSPARSRAFDFSHKLRVSPQNDASNAGEFVDLEDIRDRRSSERSCKARAAQPTRKSLSNKKLASATPRLISAPVGVAAINIIKPSEANQPISYRYDIATMKSECRGFTSTQSTDDAAHLDADALPMDLAGVPDRVSGGCGGGAGAGSMIDDFDDVSSSVSDQNDNNDYIEFLPIKSSTHTATMHTLPTWDYAIHHDDQPVKSQRFADNKYDHVNNSRGSDLKVHNESLAGPYEAFVQGAKIREVMKNAVMPSVYITPDEKLKQINKRLTSLKKRMAAFEENFELENGYRPSHSIKMSDRIMKNAMAEIHKLRKEKQALKADPMIALGLKTISADDEQKLMQMRETIADIEKVSVSQLFYCLVLTALE